MKCGGGGSKLTETPFPLTHNAYATVALYELWLPRRQLLWVNTLYSNLILS